MAEFLISVSNLYTIRPRMKPTCYYVYNGLNVSNLEDFYVQVEMGVGVGAA